MCKKVITHCPQGHEYTPDNIRKGPRRRCRQCHLDREAARRISLGFSPRKPRPVVDGQVHCQKGHVFQARPGTSSCATCHRERERESKRSKGAVPRIAWADRTHCPQGHLLTPEARRKGNSKHTGSCLICHRIRQQKIWDKKSRAYAGAIATDPCSYCGGPSGTLDHITPKKHGGTDDWSNQTSACFSCNARKQARPLLPFLLDFWKPADMDALLRDNGEACAPVEIDVEG